MGSEIENFIKVWFLATVALSYCYYVAARFPKGLTRLVSIVPILYLLTVLPLELHSFHLGGSTAFFLVWLSNFNLLLFSFDLGPLSPPPQKLFHFIALACLPIKLKNPPQEQIKKPQKLSTDRGSSTRVKNSKNPPQAPASRVSRSVLLAVKSVLLVLLFHVYSYKHCIHPYVILGLYCVHVYLEAEIVFVLSSGPARAILGFEIEPQFNEPYLASSLQDFWGRRWNLVVTGLLRPIVYDPVSRITTLLLGDWGRVLAMLAAFLVSALMHEALYYYLTRVRPTWEVTCFFVLHGICTAVEVVVKRKVNGRWWLHRAVSGPLTVAFAAATGVWLFLPQLTRNGVDERAIGEYKILVSMMCRAAQYLQSQLHYLYYLVFQ